MSHWHRRCAQTPVPVRSTRALLDIMVANEPGMRADLDTEFLHDYRVSLRRTRSLLGQIKNVFPADCGHTLQNRVSLAGASH